MTKPLAKGLANSLRMLADMESTWTITMVDKYYQDAIKLEKLGLVRFVPRYVKRGKFRGQPNGYDARVTEAGRAKLGGHP